MIRGRYWNCINCLRIALEMMKGMRKKIIPRRKSCRGTTVAHCHAFRNQYDCGAAGDVVVDPWTDCDDCYHQLLLGHSSLCTRDFTNVCQDMPSIVVVQDRHSIKGKVMKG